MGCFGGDKEKAVSADQKWDYLNLTDFTNRSCINIFSYIWLWLLILISVGVYAADTFTAVNLLAFNRWSSQVKPAIPFEISKWIFAGTILFSFALLAFEWMVAMRAIRRGGVVDSYMDPLAVIIQSIRPGKAQGFKRFLVFSELTKSKKGVNYIALFVYYQFKGAIRVIIAEGPRVVINAMTLWSVMKLNLIPEGEHQPEDGRSKFHQFFVNIEALADSNKAQAVILSAMLFTLVIWVFEILFLIVSVILYLLFLWHYIPSSDGTLARYCRRKIETRLEKIVSDKVQTGIARGEAKRRKEEQKAAKKDDRPQLLKQPTLPLLALNDDSKSNFTLERQNSLSSLPPYSSQPPTLSNTIVSGSTGARQPTLPTIEDEYQRPGMSSRTETQSSEYSTYSDGPLLSGATPMGYGEPGRASPVPSLPPLDRMNDYNRPAPSRSMTGNSNASRSYTPMARPGTANSQGRNGPTGMRPPPRSNTGFDAYGRSSPAPINTNNGSVNRRPPGPSARSDQGWSPYEGDYSASQGQSYEMSPVEANSRQNDEYNQPPPSSLTLGPGRSNIGYGGPPRGDTFSAPPQQVQRSHTAPMGQPDASRGGYRSASAAPQQMPVASQRQGGGWHGGARLGGGQFRR